MPACVAFYVIENGIEVDTHATVIPFAWTLEGQDTPRQQTLLPAYPVPVPHLFGWRQVMKGKDVLSHLFRCWFPW